MKYIAIFFLIFFTQTGWCQSEVDTSRKTDSAQLPIDVDFQPELGTYFYDIFWKGARVGKAAITIDFLDNFYKISVHADSNSKISMLYKFKYKGEVEVEPYPLKPLQAKVTERSGRKEKKIEINFPQKDKVEAIEVKSVGGKTRTITEKSATSDSFIIDPFSVVFLVRNLDWQIGMAEGFDIFTGKKKYELKLLCDSVVSLTVGNTTKEAWLIIPDIKDLSKKEKKKRTEFKVYLSKDEKKEILKIEGVPRIGRVEARVRKFVPKSPTN